MTTITKAIRTTGRIDKSKGLVIPGPLPLDENTDVEVIIIPDDDEFSEIEWMRWLASNPAYDFLKDEAEDIYTLADGRPINVEG